MKANLGYQTFYLWFKSCVLKILAAIKIYIFCEEAHERLYARCRHQIKLPFSLVTLSSPSDIQYIFKTLIRFYCQSRVRTILFYVSWIVTCLQTCMLQTRTRVPGRSGHGSTRSPVNPNLDLDPLSTRIWI